MALLLCTAGSVLLAGPAAAHSVLLSTNPGSGATVAAAPATVQLTFNEPPRQRFSTVHVTGPDGQRRDRGSATVTDDVLSQSVGGSLPAGVYTVDWRIVSGDGHVVSGQFTFTSTSAAGSDPVTTPAPTAGSAAPATASPEASHSHSPEEHANHTEAGTTGSTATGDHDSGRNTGVIVGFVVVALVLIGGVVAVTLRRRRPAGHIDEHE